MRAVPPRARGGALAKMRGPGRARDGAKLRMGIAAVLPSPGCHAGGLA